MGSIPASFDPPAGRRGFTGQESIPSTGLVNMNGRVYDPQVARFLSPDPTIQFVSDLQSYNRYAYAMGNPLRYTDPTGYSITGSTWGDAAVGIGIGVLGAATLLADRPKGYVQRVALGVVGVVLFGACLGHVGYLANQSHYRPLVLWLLTSSLLQPILATATRRLPGPILLPNTAPGQTLFATLGTMLLTTAFAAFAGYFACFPLHGSAFFCSCRAAGCSRNLVIKLDPNQQPTYPV